jgi:hypothetical protein
MRLAVECRSKSTEKSQGKGALGRPRCKWKKAYNIKMDLRKLGRVGVDWILLSQDRVQWQLFWTWYRTFRFHKIRVFLRQLNDYELVKEDVYHVIRQLYIKDSLPPKYSHPFISYCLLKNRNKIIRLWATSVIIRGCLAMGLYSDNRPYYGTAW